MAAVNASPTRVVIITTIQATLEARAMRQLEFFYDSGAQVVFIGRSLRQIRNKYPNARFMDLDLLASSASGFHFPYKLSILGFIQRILRTFLSLAVGLLPVEVSYRPSTWIFFMRAPYSRALKREVRKLEASTDLFLANDWQAAVYLQHLKGDAKKWIDSHEHVPSQYSYLGKSGRLRAKLHESIDRWVQMNADYVTYVSECIQESITERYKLKIPTAVMRSIPNSVPVISPTIKPDELSLLYLGFMTGGRGIETLLDAVPRVSRKVRLTLRGPFDQYWYDSLSARHKAALESEWCSLGPAVERDRLAKFASHFDLGVYIPPRSGLQKVCSLPNKFFEYIFGGLALLVPADREMAKLVTTHSFGRVLDPTLTVESICELLETVPREELDDMKNRSHRFARSLDWRLEHHNALVRFGLLDLLPNEISSAAK